MSNIEMEVDDEGSVYIVCPAAMFPGEPGDEFPEESKDFLRLIAMAGWYAVDFGESTDTHVTIWLKLHMQAVHPSHVDAVSLMENFISRGGDV